MQNVTPSYPNFIEFHRGSMRRDRNKRRRTSIEILVGHNYSELFDSRYIKVSYKGILFQRCFPLPTHSLSYYPFTNINNGQRTFYKAVLLATFDSIYIEQFFMLFFIPLPPPYYIYIYVYNLFRSNRFDLYWKRPRVTTSRRPSLKKKTSDKSVILLLPPRKISNYLVN